MIILPRLYSGRIPPPPPPAERPFSRLAQHQGILLPLTNTQPPPLSNMIIMRTDICLWYAIMLSLFFLLHYPPPPPPRPTRPYACSHFLGKGVRWGCLFVCLFREDFLENARGRGVCDFFLTKWLQIPEISKFPEIGGSGDLEWAKYSLIWGKGRIFRIRLHVCLKGQYSLYLKHFVPLLFLISILSL